MLRLAWDRGLAQVALQACCVFVLLALAGCGGGTSGGGGDTTPAGGSDTPGGGGGSPPAETPEAPDSPNVAMGALGGDFTCALSVSGRIRCWGYPGNGRLGFGPNAPDIGVTQTPAAAWGTTHVDVGGKASMVVTGEAFACALLLTGDVRCWGIQGPWLGQPGNATDIGTDRKPSEVPVVDIGGKATFIAAGFNHVCVLLDSNAVRCWGSADAGQLGTGSANNIGTTEAPSAATAVDFGGGTVKQIVAGAHHTCVLLSAGTVRCWGAGVVNGVSSGNIGDTTTPAAAYGNLETTGDVPLGPGAVAAQLTAGHSHTCARLDSGKIFCWGGNVAGQLGADTEIDPIQNYDSPGAAYVNLGGALATFVGAGWYHTCTVDSAMHVRCWGHGAFGKLGINNNPGLGISGNSNLAAPLDYPVEMGEGTPIAVLGGQNHTCALMADFTARCWGKGAQGQLGYALGSPDMGPDDTRNITLDWSAMGDFALTGLLAGDNFNCATGGGTYLACWGANDHGQLGTGSFDPIGDDEAAGFSDTYGHTLGDIVPGGAQGSANSPVAGSNHICFYKYATAAVYCWGADAVGQLGDGSTSDLPAPNSILAGDTAITAIGAGAAHNCIYVTTNTEMYCWGKNSPVGATGSGGQLGIGSTADQNAPQLAFILSNTDDTIDITGIAGGSQHTCVLIDNGKVMCWGSNHVGQLGVGSNCLSVGAVLVHSGSDCKLFDPEILDATTASAPEGVAIAQGVLATKVAARGDTSCAQGDDGKVYCWGVVNGSNTNVPVVIDFGEAQVHTLVDFAIGGDGVYAILNVSGTYEVRRGDGALIVSTFSTFFPSTIVAGASHVCVRLNTTKVKCWGSNNSGQLGFDPTMIGSIFTPATFYTDRLGGDGAVHIFPAASP